MDISQFERVYKPQAPAAPADTVTQGCFLEISNLEDRTLQFGLAFTTAAVPNPDRSLSGNAAVFVDTPGSDNNAGRFSLVGGLGAKTFTLDRRVTVPAHGTALVALLPSDPFPPASVPAGAADFECRGYVTLTLPAILQQVDREPVVFPRFVRAAQSDRPVRVMLTAQSRAIHTDPSSGAVMAPPAAERPRRHGGRGPRYLAAC